MSTWLMVEWASVCKNLFPGDKHKSAHNKQILPQAGLHATPKVLAPPRWIAAT